VISGPAQTTLDYYQPTEFRVGSALGRALDLLFRNFVPFVAISALATVPLFFYEYSALSHGRLGTWIQTGLNSALTGLCTAMILFGVFQALRGRPVPVGASIARGLTRAVPVVIASLLVSLITTLGYFLLIIPGLIAAMAFFVTLPACVVERLGPIDSMSRSAELTKGHRWGIFGAVFVVGLIDLVVIMILLATLHRPESLLAFNIALYGYSTLSRAYESVLVGIIYHDLRVVKEGIDLDKIASVFD
jgi:hypothetical protein